MAKNNRNNYRNNNISTPTEPSVIHPLQMGTLKVERSLEHVGHHAEVHAGPIPSPEVFRKYGEVVHDAPERILKVFELDSEHTREMQKLALTGQINRDKRAQWMAFFIMLASLGITLYAIIAGKSVTAGIAGLSTLFVALGVLFGDKNKATNKPKDPKPDE